MKYFKEEVLKYFKIVKYFKVKYFIVHPYSALTTIKLPVAKSPFPQYSSSERRRLALHTAHTLHTTASGRFKPISTLFRTRAEFLSEFRMQS